MFPKTARLSGGDYSSNNAVFLALAAFAIGMAWQAAWAHSSSRADQPRYGGEARQAGDLFIELVATADGLTLHARDRRERVVALQPTQVQALLWTEEGNQPVPLTADGYGLASSAAMPADSRLRVIVTFARGGKDTHRLLFGPISLAANP